MIEKEIGYDDLTPEELNIMLTERLHHYLALESKKGNRSKKTIMKAAARCLNDEMGDEWIIRYEDKEK
jgi:hypothetical protein